MAEQKQPKQVLEQQVVELKQPTAIFDLLLTNNLRGNLPQNGSRLIERFYLLDDPRQIEKNKDKRERESKKEREKKVENELDRESYMKS